jgi:glycine oxidase
LFRHIVTFGARYLVPRPDGCVLAGSTEENAGFDKRTTAAAVAGLLALAARLVPGLADAPVERCWAGLRPGSPDGMPFLGPVPGLDNLFVAAGHFRSGIQLAPATGVVMTDLLLERPPSLPIDAFRPDRDVAADPAFRP